MPGRSAAAPARLGMGARFAAMLIQFSKRMDGSRGQGIIKVLRSLGGLRNETYWPQVNADERRCPYSLTERVLGAVFEVSNTLGAGFLEKVYERALLRELALRGIRAEPQAAFKINYKGYPVGDYFADILVEDSLVVELKCVDQLGNDHTAQCLNYLKASGRTVCILVNFQKARVEWKRIVSGFENTLE